jgi:PadR family transcriptional regulator, regulatory protein AphA
MARESKSKYAILGLLAAGPMSGYDIKKRFERVLGNFWSESYGRIYPALATLVAEGFAVKSVQAGNGRPDRHVSQITPAGREELRRWLSEPAEDLHIRAEVLLKVLFGAEVGPEVTAGHVRRFRDSYETALDQFEQGERLATTIAPSAELEYGLMTLRLGTRFARMAVEWSDETLAALDSLAHRSPPATNA